MGNFYNNSGTPASNTTIGGVAASGGTTLNFFDDVVRELAAQGRNFANDLGGNNTVGGTADAITITPSSGSITAAYKGLLIGFVAAYDNATPTPTANVGGLGAEPIKKAIGGVESTLAVRDIQAGAFCWLLWRPTWDSSNGAWELISAGVSGSSKYRNRIINGNFDVWQRGTSFAAFDYLADRWRVDGTGSTIVQSRQSFTLGQTDVPGEPEYFHRTAVTSVAGVGNYVHVIQRIEDVRTFAGQNVVLSFWAKADATKNVCVEFIQNFGTGGSPSTQVNVSSPTTISLTTSWQKFTVTSAIPSIAGKTLGTDNNDWFGLAIWLDAGSNFDARTNSLGQQSGTFDIAQVQMESGSTATPFEKLSYAEELARCQTYYHRMTSAHNAYTRFGLGQAYSTTMCEFHIQHPQTMRGPPTFQVSGATAALTAGAGVLALNSLVLSMSNPYMALLTGTGSAASLSVGQATQLISNNSTAVFVAFDAEL